MNFRFPKTEKLKSRKQIEKLFEEGDSIKVYPLRIRFLKVDEAEKPLQVSFSVPKRNFKGAVDRIRIKRVLREVYRKNKQIVNQDVQSSYIVMFMFTDRQEWNYEDLEKKMISLLTKFNNQLKTD
jgi:ribonuclease P protein component